MKEREQMCMHKKPKVRGLTVNLIWTVMMYNGPAAAQIIWGTENVFYMRLSGPGHSENFVSHTRWQTSQSLLLN